MLDEPVQFQHAFIGDHRECRGVGWLCRLLDLNPVGYYAWRANPQSLRAVSDQRLTGLTMQFSPAPGGVHAYRKLHTDLRDIREICAPDPMHQLIKQAGLKAHAGLLVGRCNPE